MHGLPLAKKRAHNKGGKIDNGHEKRAVHCVNALTQYDALPAAALAGHPQCSTCRPGFRFVRNYVRTTKYTLWSFLPVNLFEQFNKKANIYFLLTAIISFTKISPQTPVVSVAPLVFVLAVTAIKEGIEDYRRHQQDVAVNNRIARVWTTNPLSNPTHHPGQIPAEPSNGPGQFEEIPWDKVEVGDLVLVHADEEFPADMVLIKTSIKTGSCSIETSNLDGETNLKIKQSRPETYVYGGFSGHATSPVPGAHESGSAAASPEPRNRDACAPDGSDFPLFLPTMIVESSPPNKELLNSSSAWTGTLRIIGRDPHSVGSPEVLIL